MGHQMSAEPMKRTTFFLCLYLLGRNGHCDPPNKRQQQKEAGKTSIDANGKFTRITGMSLDFFRIFGGWNFFCRVCFKVLGLENVKEILFNRIVNLLIFY
jgi:hypothetical protein